MENDEPLMWDWVVASFDNARVPYWCRPGDSRTVIGYKLKTLVGVVVVVATTERRLPESEQEEFPFESFEAMIPLHLALTAFHSAFTDLEWVALVGRSMRH
jgi:hypothetical protein